MLPYNMTRQEMLLAVSGGILASIATCMFFILFGKLLGKDLLIRKMLSFKYSTDFAIRTTVLAGVIFSSALVKELYHEHFISFWPYDTRKFEQNTDIGVLVVAGLLVGFGATLSGGCTYGHGVAGIPRLNIWSFVAVIIFSVTAYYTNEWELINFIPKETAQHLAFSLPDNIRADFYASLSLIVPFVFFVLAKDKSLLGLFKFIVTFAIGVISGLGMMVGGVGQRDLVLHMFKYDRNWDPTIIIFFGTTILINFIVFTIILRKK